jgi:hypothetical protein
MNLLLFLLLLSAATHPVRDAGLLQRAGKAEELFWEQLAAVNCVESVEQEKLGSNGKALSRQLSDFDYLAVLQFTGDDLLMEESRAPIRQSDQKKGLPLLITNGFSTFGFIFHPFYQGGFEYSAPRPVVVEGRQLEQIDFRQARGGRSPTVLKLREREYPLAWQGTAWIDPESAAVVRIQAGLMSSMEDLGLKAIRADVRYTRVEFKEDAAPHWMPEVATVEVETLRQHWRNVHRFSKYRLFSVDVKQDVGAPK